MATLVNAITERITRRLDAAAIASFVIPFAVYALTVCPTVAILDSAELTTAAVSLGLTRATGYPLYILTGFLWSRLPLGNYAFRMNLFSALNGALTILLTYLIMKRFKLPNWASAIALGLLATSPFFWGLSLVAEVYTFHTVLMAATILLMLNWAERPSGLNTFWLFLMVGLSLTNHMSSLLTLPGLGLFLLAKDHRRILTPKLILLAFLGLAAGLLPYLYLPLRYSARPAFNYAGLFDGKGLFYPVNLHKFKGVWWVASGKVFSTRVGDNWRVWDQTILIFLRGLWRSFFGLGIGPGIYGLVLMVKKYRWEAVFLIITFLLNLIFFTTYRVIDLETMFLPIYLIFAIWVGFGLKGLIKLVKTPGDEGLFYLGERRIYTADIIILLLLIFVGFVTVWNWPLVNQANNWEGRDKAQAIFDQVEECALIFGKWTTIPILQYFQIVEGQRPDLYLVNRFLISPENMTIWIGQEAVAEGRPVYIDYLTPDLISHFKFEEANPLYRVRN
jgi:hypothetical protein